VSSSGNTVVGNYSVLDTNPTITGANFVGSPVYVGNLTVTPKALTAAMTASNKVYDGGVLATATGSSTDIVAGDKVSFANTSATFANKNAGTGKTVTVTGITIGDTDAGNYVLQNSTASATADITPKALTLMAGPVSKTYDGSTGYTTQMADLTTLSSQLASGDAVSAATIRYADKNAGNGNKVVTLDAVTLSDGNNGGNYTVTLAGNSTSTITPKAVTLNALSVSKTYDGGTNYTTTSADLSTLSSQLVGGDTVTAATIRYADKNAAVGSKVVTLDAVTVNDGNNGGNYAVTRVGNNSSTIDKRPASVVATDARRTFTGQPQSLDPAVAKGFLNGDRFEILGLANGTTPGLYRSNLSVVGPDAGNYSISYQNATLEILPIGSAQNVFNGLWQRNVAPETRISYRGFTAAGNVSAAVGRTPSHLAAPSCSPESTAECECDFKPELNLEICLPVRESKN
jgi:hypothetical protein